MKLNHNLNLRLDAIEVYPIQTDSQGENVIERNKQVLNSVRTSHLNDEEAEALLNLYSSYSDIFHLPDEPLSFTSAI